MKRDTVVQASNTPQIIKDFTDTPSLMEWAKEMVASSLVPFARPQDLVLAACWAHENGFPVINVLPYIFIVNDRLAVATKLERALIQRGNVIIETVEDYRAIYQYRGKNDLLLHEDDLNNTYEVFPNAEVFKALAAAGKIDKDTGITSEGKVAVIRGAKPIDYRTKVKLTRILPSVEGPKEVSEVGIFCWTDAIRAELTNKDNWTKYPKAMLYARAFSIASNRLCADLLMGSVSIYEFPDAPDLGNPEDIEYTEV